MYRTIEMMDTTEGGLDVMIRKDPDGDYEMTLNGHEYYLDKKSYAQLQRFMNIAKKES